MSQFRESLNEWPSPKGQPIVSDDEIRARLFCLNQERSAAQAIKNEGKS